MIKVRIAAAKSISDLLFTATCFNLFRGVGRFLQLWKAPMKKERQQRGNLAFPSVFDLDVLAVGVATLVFLGVVAKTMFGWLLG